VYFIKPDPVGFEAGPVFLQACCKYNF